MGKQFSENEYVIWGECDQSTNIFLNDKCEKLKELGIAPGILPPHMTLTFFRSDQMEQVKKALIHFFNKNDQIQFKLNSVGAFSAGILFYEPKVTIRLLELQEELCKELKENATLSWDIYEPGHWTPHIALTGVVSKLELEKAFRIMMEDFIERDVHISTLKVKNCYTGQVVMELFLD